MMLLPLLKISDTAGSEATILPYGAILHSLRILVHGQPREVLVNLPDWRDYITDQNYIGSIIGRVANRISGAKFRFGNIEHNVTANEAPNCLHGGAQGFGKQVWEIVEHSTHRVVLSYLSPNGEEGFPGNVKVLATFEFVAPKSLRISYDAETDAPTPIDLTHHLYFNLASGAGGAIEDHLLQVHSDSVLELDRTYVPTGDVLRLPRTPFDLNKATKLGDLLARKHYQLTRIGLNQSWILRPVEPAFRMIAPDHSLELAVSTDQPCLQLYSGLNRENAPAGALAVEPQGYIDAVNRFQFPSPWLVPRERYRRSTLYEFFDAPKVDASRPLTGTGRRASTTGALRS
ncbi:aldose epimerase family protein [Asticcacaulis sp. W401b]|uniref:aldose epimerase family protein n=1 Tax=Asticcacaulis sp. W401b TaxID=3388666 RepID=UPI00397099FD